MSYNSKYTGAEVEALLDAANGKQDKIEDLDAIRAGAALGATALQSVPSEYVTESELSAKGYATTSALNDKVDKVSGKGLSTEDFTTALKTKLEGLNNYDDSEIEDAVSSLQTQLNTLVSGNANDAINSFNEIIAFLDGVKDTQDLASIIASIEQQIASKMDKVTLAAVATSGSYNDLSNKPTIPSAVTESTVSGWGFTKNTGTYSKPSGGIPKTDLASAVQTSLSKADSAVAARDFGNYKYADDLDGIISKGQVYYSLPDSVSDVSIEDDIIVTVSTLKTINGQSLIGSGDIAISGGGGGGKEYVAAPLMTEPMGTSIFFTNAVPLEPNKVYVAKKKVSAINADIISIPDSSIGAEYTIMFQAATSELSISISQGTLLWANGAIPTIEADTYYELSLVLNNINNTKIFKAVLTPFKQV